MTTFHLSAFLASLATGIALPLRFEVVASVLFTAGFAVIVVSDYARSTKALPTPARQRVLRARAQFRPLPLTLPTEPRGIEIRPIIHRLRERNRLAA
ncbi:MAG: hypothetical protein NTV51_21525 [Verrucomicrobia bacterium]|nr:hypothetical protein [Verrucomicrobiota bacterium]